VSFSLLVAVKLSPFTVFVFSARHRGGVFHSWTFVIYADQQGEPMRASVAAHWQEHPNAPQPICEELSRGMEMNTVVNELGISL
jgi:hypothetical protein